MMQLPAGPEDPCSARPRVAVVVLNYRTPQLTVDCLHSLAADAGATGPRVWMVDNASSDGSAETVAKAVDAHGWAGWVQLLALDRNLGFAGGNNAAVRAGLAEKPDYFWLLNSDTIVRPGALRALVDFMDQHPDVGVCGSRLETLDGTPQRSAFRFPSLRSQLDDGLGWGVLTRLFQAYVVAPPVRNEAHETDWVPGASLMIRRQVLEQIGLLDENYFMYYEDADFCLRARKAGWKVWYVPQARVVHLGGQSTGGTSRENQRPRPRYWFDAHRWYFVKNHGRVYAITAETCWLAGYLTWRVRRVLQRKPDIYPPRMLWDTLRWSLWPMVSGR